MTKTPQDIADTLAGKKTLFVHSHPLSGALIELGELVLRPKPVKNDALPELERLYEGTHSIFMPALVLQSPSKLRLDGGRPVGDEVWRPLDRLVGHILLKAEFSNPSLDLALTFDNDMRVTVETNYELNERARYTIRIGALYWSVDDGRISEEDLSCLASIHVCHEC